MRKYLFIAVFCVIATAALARGGLFGGGQISAIIPPATPVTLSFVPASPSISDTSLAATQVATLNITMSDNSVYAGSVPVFCTSSCGNNFGNGGSLFSLTGPANPTLRLAQNLNSTNDGTYNSTVKVTQNGVSIFADIAVTIIPGTGTPCANGQSPFLGTAPSAAALAGYVTCAGNFDFSNGAYAVLSNWMDCPSHTGNRQIWHQGYGQGVNPGLPCNIGQVVDSKDNSTVMRFEYLPSYDGSFTGALNAIGAETFNPVDVVSTLDFPMQVYYEGIYRTGSTYADGGNPSGGPNGLWWGTAYSHLGAWTANFSDYIECDVTELFAGQGGFGDGQCGNHNNNSGGLGSGWESYSNNNLPSGWLPTDYHKYGILFTSNGSQAYACMFVDDILQNNCTAMNPVANLGASGTQVTNRTWAILGVNSFTPPTPQTIDMYYKYARMWTCSAWLTDATANCFGSTLTTTTQNGKQLIYYH